MSTQMLGHIEGFSNSRVFLVFCNLYSVTVVRSQSSLTSLKIKIKLFLYKVVRPDPPAEGHQWFAVLVPKVGNFVEATHQPLGPIIYKKKILEALGYQVIIINAYEWNQLREKGKTRNFLFDKFLLKAKNSIFCQNKQ